MSDEFLRIPGFTEFDRAMSKLFSSTTYGGDV